MANKQRTDKTRAARLRTLQTWFRKVIPASARSYLYQRLGERWQAQLDAWETQIEVARPLDSADLRLPQGPIGPSRFPRRVNKLCELGDWQGEEWLGLLDELGEPQCRQQKHRKAWEWAQGCYALRHLGLLREDATAIGVGAGVEGVLFFLANHIKLVLATDIYGEGDFAANTAASGMLTNPAQFSKIPYRQDHLQVQYMNALQLEAEDNSFDFAFSFSSIEHFGGHEASARAVAEMGRVVKPGGAVVLTTEVVVNGLPHEEFFLPEEVRRYLIDNTGLRPIEDVDYSFAAENLQEPVPFGGPRGYAGILPHVLLKAGPHYWTSLCLVLEKPA